MRCPACHRRVGPAGRCLLDGTEVAPEEDQAPSGGGAPAIPGMRLLEPIGRGGFATVWAAQRDDGGEPCCAVKVAHRPGERIAERFQREADALAAVGPPWVPELLGSGRLADGRPYLVLELLDGRTLADELAGMAAPPPLERVRALADGILTALEAVHARGIVHRDLKPENVFCAGGEPVRARLFDFGLVRVVEAAAAGGGDLTRAGAILGSAHYMAPEQFSAGAAIDERTDLYAVGVVLYELFTLRVPFVGDANAVELGHRMHRPPRPSQLAPVPHALEEVVLACLAKAPERRPVSASALRGDLAQAFAAAAGARSVRAEAPAPATGTTRLTGHKKEPLVLLAVDGAIGLDALGAACALRGGFVAHQRGERSVAVFTSASESPMGAAIATARGLAREVGLRLAIHVTHAALRRRETGPPSVYSADCERSERWTPPAAGWTGILLTEAATGALGGEDVQPAVEHPGFHRLGERDGGALGAPAAAALIGRDELIAAVERSWDECVASAVPALFTLLGQPGLGRSRLLAELARRAALRFPRARILSLAVPSRLAGDGDSTLAQLAAELGLADGERTLRAVGDALRRAAADRPTFLLLDDAHRASDATLDLVEYLTLEASATPLWVAVAADPRLEVVRRRWGERAERHQRHLLAPLDETAAMRLAAELLQPAEFPPAEALRRIAGWSGGNPHKLVEIARALHREGIVRRRPGSDAWHLATAELERLPASPTSQWLAASQLALLVPELATLARLAAGLGMVFERDELHALQDALERAGSAPTPLDTDRGLDALVAAGILERVGAGGDKLVFASATVHDGVQSMLSAGDRETLHALALQFWMLRRERAGATDPEVLSSIAAHAAGCRQHALAADAHVVLGELAAAQHRPVDSELHFGAALRALEGAAGDDGAARGRALLGRGRVRYRIGRTSESLEDLALARALAEERGDQAALAETLLEEATALDWAGRYADSAQRTAAAAALIAADAPPALAGHLALAQGRAAAREARYNDSIPLLARAAEIGAIDTRTVALVLLAPVLALTDRLDESEARFAEVIALTARTGDRVHLGAALDNRVFLWNKLDRHERATGDLREVIQLAREMGQPTLECRALHNLGDVLFIRGAEDEALELARRARRIEERQGGTPVSFVTLLTARILALRGERDRTRELVDWISAHCTLEGLAWYEQEMLKLFLAYAPRADWVDLIDRARREIQEDHLGLVYFWARTALAGGRTDEVREAIEAAAGPLRIFPSWRGRFEELAARIAAAG